MKNSYTFEKRPAGSPTTHDGIAPLIIAGGIAAASSLLGGVLASKGQSSANKTNMAIAQSQNQFNYDQWNRENEYNTPSSQLARLKEAGLNPNLIYGNGQAVTTSAASPRAQGTHVSNENVGIAGGMSSAAQMLLNSFMNQTEVNKLNAQSDLLKSQRDLAVLNQNVAQTVATKNVAQADYYGSASNLNESRGILINHQIDNIDAQTLATRAKTTTMETFNRYADDIYKNKVEYQSALTNLTNAQKSALSQKIAQAWKALDISEFNASTNASRSYTYQQIADQQIQNLQSGKSAIDIKNELDSERLDYKHTNAFFEALKTATSWLSPFQK